MAIEHLFDRLRGAAARGIDLAELGHRLIGVVEIEPLGARHAHPAAPVIGMAVGTRDQQPVQHREINRAREPNSNGARVNYQLFRLCRKFALCRNRRSALQTQS